MVNSILSTEGATRLRRGRLVYGGGDSSTEGETHLRRGRLIHRGGDSSTQGETCLRRGRLIFGGGGGVGSFICRKFLLMVEQDC
jgi:hypothetical protein